VDGVAPPPVIIVGAAMGGLRTAEGLRKGGYMGPLTVIGEEPHAPYNRPPLSKDVLAGVVTHESVAFPQRASTADVEWMLGARVVAIDLTARTVTTDDEVVHPYAALVIATGLRPRRLDLPDIPGRHTVRTLDDAIALRDELVPGAHVVIVGSGFIGCEVAATARKLGCEVTVVSPSALPIVRPLGSLLAAEILARQEAHGVAFRLGHTVTGLVGGARLHEVVLDDGTVLPSDVLIEAIGSDCNSEWLAGAGLDCSDGVLADAAMRAVSVDGSVHDDVYVVGDIARFPNAMFDDVPRRVEHWNIPTDTGKRAGFVLAAWLNSPEAFSDAVQTPFAPMPAFWSNQFEMALQAYGLPGLADGIRLLQGSLTSEAVVGYYRGDRMVGVVGLGMKAALLPYRKVIAEGGLSVSPVT